MDFKKQTEAYDVETAIFKGKTLEIFQSLINQFNIQNVYSYRESGVKDSFEIDKKVITLFNPSLAEHLLNGNLRFFLPLRFYIT